MSGGQKPKRGAARKSGPSHRSDGLMLRIGDRVRILQIPSDLKDPDYDQKDGERREMRTAELFRFCLGRDFTIRGFNQYGYAELEVDEDAAIRKRFGKFHTIWMEPEYLEVVKKRMTKRRTISR